MERPLEGEFPNWAIRKTLAVLHEALEAQANQIDALEAQLRQLRRDSKDATTAVGTTVEQRVVETEQSTSFVTAVEQRIEIVERLLEKRTQDEIYNLERHASMAKDIHQRLAALEARSEQRAAPVDATFDEKMMRQIAGEVVEEHEERAYSMVGEAKMARLEERVGVVEDGLREKASTSELKRAFDDVWEELQTKANALAVERELVQVQSEASALGERVEDQLQKVWEETRTGLAASRDAMNRNSAWLTRLEASQRDLVTLAESQAERIKNMNFSREIILDY